MSSIGQLENLKQQTTSSVLLDPEGRIVWVDSVWNESAHKRGLETNWIGVNYIEIIRRASACPDSHLQEVLDGLLAVLRGTEDYFQYEYTCDAGSGARWYIETAEAINDGTRRVLISHLDVTKLYRLSGREHNQIYKSAFDDSSLPKFIVGLDRRVLIVNKAALNQFGYTKDELIGQPSRLLYSSDQDWEIVGGMLSRALQGEKPNTRLFTMRRKDGRTFPGLCSGAVLRNDEGQPLCAVAIVQDLTSQREREEELSRSRRLETLGRFTGGVAHDFNNLLTVISGNLQLLSSRVNDDLAIRAISDVQHAADVATNLTRKLLAFAGGRPLNVKRTHLGDTIGILVKLLRRILPQDVRIDHSVEDELWAINVDPLELENAVINLAMNARDALGEIGGKIDIAARNVFSDADADADDIDFLVRGQQRYVELAVTDTGRGMTEEVRMKAFEPFFTTKSNEGSSGLGLATVHSFVRRSGGRIFIHSSEGRGTRVSMYFPAITEVGASPSSVAAHPTGAAIAQGGTALVVDDNVAVRRVAVGMLKLLGFEVLEADSGRTALAVAGSASKLDLLFSDIVMPGGVSGEQLADQLRERNPNLAVLLTTGWEEHIRSAYPRLMKPYKLEELSEAIKNCLDRRS